MAEEEIDLEEKFYAASDAVSAEMRTIREELSKLYARAAQLSEDHGIPIRLDGSTYVPDSMKELYGSLDGLNEKVDFININMMSGRDLPTGEWWAPSTLLSGKPYLADEMCNSCGSDEVWCRDAHCDGRPIRQFVCKDCGESRTETEDPDD